MKWILMVVSFVTLPTLAAYQPTDEEAQMLQANRVGLERNMKNALPLQAKTDICIGYIKNSGVLKNQAGYVPEVVSVLEYWGRVKHYVDQSVDYAGNRYPRLYYYDQKLYEKYGPYPKDNADTDKLFNDALSNNYLNAKDYIAATQQYSEDLRKKDLHKICLESVTKKMRGQLSPATASMDKLFYPGITSDDTGEKFNEYRAQFYGHLQFTQLLNKIEASYY